MCPNVQNELFHAWLELIIQSIHYLYWLIPLPPFFFLPHRLTSFIQRDDHFLSQKLTKPTTIFCISQELNCIAIFRQSSLPPLSAKVDIHVNFEAIQPSIKFSFRTRKGSSPINLPKSFVRVMQVSPQTRALTHPNSYECFLLSLLEHFWLAFHNQTVAGYCFLYI